MNSIDVVIKKIIIIDDQESIHQDFRKIFSVEEEHSEALSLAEAILSSKQEHVSKACHLKNSYTLDFALQGQEGVSKILEAKKLGDPYHLAFVDMRMPPGWDGLETLEHILKAEDQIQIVICTAYTDYSLEEITKRVGLQERFLILRKPFEKIEVLQLANNLCEKWCLARKAELKMAELQAMVDERVKQIEEYERRILLL